MTTVFVDTVGWVALLNKSDVLHEEALHVLEDLRHQGAHLVTTEFVLLEVADALSEPFLRTNTADFIAGLRGCSFLTIVPLSQQLFADGLTIYSQRPSRGWSLTDCTSFVTMNQRSISVALTSDHHFEQAGFVILLFRRDAET